MSRPYIDLPVHTIKNFSGFENLEFSPASDVLFGLPAAISYRKSFGGQLQSVGEAVAFSIGAEGYDSSNRNQLARTAAIAFLDDGIIKVAFDDATDPAQNILLARVGEGVAMYEKHKPWLVSVDDPFIKATIERARSATRVVPAIERYCMRYLALDGEHITDPMLKAMLADSVEGHIASAYAKFLTEYGIEKSSVHVPTTKEFNENGVNSTTAQVLNVELLGLSGCDRPMFSAESCSAHKCFPMFYHARRVREAQK